MAKVYLDGEGVEVAEGQTVLDALLTSGREVAHSCKAGSCQSCMMRATEGEVSKASQVGIKPTLREQGYFLACMEKPTEDVHVSLEGVEALTVSARVAGVEPLSGDVVKLTVEPTEPLSYRPGQFVNLVRPDDGLVRSYSIASAPGWDGAEQQADADANLLEMHIRQIPNGRMSNWIASEVGEGDMVDVRGPAGECFYLGGEPEQPLLLAGTGTGLAPLWGIARDALAQGHTGPIVIYHGARDAAGLYMVEELKALAAAHENVTYRRCVLNGEADEPGVTIGRLDEQLLRAQPKLAGWRVYLCGDPTLVNGMRKKVFLAGASMQAIHADAFVTAGSPEAANTTASAG